jgi:hypothetical protein
MWVDVRDVDSANVSNRPITTNKTMHVKNR